MRLHDGNPFQSECRLIDDELRQMERGFSEAANSQVYTWLIMYIYVCIYDVSQEHALDLVRPTCNQPYLSK